MYYIGIKYPVHTIATPPSCASLMANPVVTNTSLARITQSAYLLASSWLQVAEHSVAIII